MERVCETCKDQRPERCRKCGDGYTLWSDRPAPSVPLECDEWRDHAEEAYNADTLRDPAELADDLPGIGSLLGEEGGAHPMNDTVKLDGLEGHPLRLEEWTKHEGGRGPYVTMRGVDLETGEPFHARSSSEVIIDQLVKAARVGSLPYRVVPTTLKGASQRPYMKLL